MSYESISKNAQFTTAAEAEKWADAAMAFVKSEGFSITNYSLNGNYCYDRKGNVIKDSQFFSVTVSGKKGDQVQQYQDYDDLD